MSAYGPTPASGIPGLGQAQRVGRSDPDKRRRKREDEEERKKKSAQRAAPAGDSVELHEASPPAPPEAPVKARDDKRAKAEPPPGIDLQG